MDATKKIAGAAREAEACSECGGVRTTLMIANMTDDHQPTILWDRNRPVRESDKRRAHKPDPQPFAHALMVTVCENCDATEWPAIHSECPIHDEHKHGSLDFVGPHRCEEPSIHKHGVAWAIRGDA